MKDDLVYKTIVKVLIETKEAGAIQFFHFIPHAIAIVGFLTAVQYFSGRPHLKVFPYINTKEFHLNLAPQFYKDNNLEPAILVSELFEQIEKPLRYIHKDPISLFVGVSDLDIVRAIKKGQRFSKHYLKERIEKLENQLDKYEYKQRIYGYESSGYIAREYVKEKLDEFKSKLSTEDYFIFFTAVLFSRQVSNSISIMNDGDLDVSDLQITISPPFSKVTNNRKGNILDFGVDSTLPHNVKESPLGLSITLPILKKNESFLLHIQTRENQIEESDISCSYKADRMVDFWKALVFCGVIFLMLTTLGLFWKRN